MKKRLTTLLITAFICCIISIQLPSTFANHNDEQKPDVLATLNYYPKEYDFLNMLEGEQAETTFEIWRGGGCCSLSYSIYPQEEWISVFPTSGTSYGEHDLITVTIDTTNLPPDRYTGEVKIQSNCGNGVFTVYVSVVENTEPTLAFEPKSYDFGKVAPDAEESTTFEIWNNGLGTLDYALSEESPWLKIVPDQGSSQGERDSITVEIDTDGLDYGPYSSEIAIESNAGNDVFPISFHVEPIPELTITIRGGIGITVKVHNTGITDISSMQWELTLTGGTIIIPDSRQASGVIPELKAGESETIKTTVLGFGNIQIQFQADNHEETKPGFVILPFVLTR